MWNCRHTQTGGALRSLSAPPVFLRLGALRDTTVRSRQQDRIGIPPSYPILQEKPTKLSAFPVCLYPRFYRFLRQPPHPVLQGFLTASSYKMTGIPHSLPESFHRKNCGQNAAKRAKRNPQSLVYQGFAGKLRLLPLGKFRYSRVYLR